MTHQPPFMSDEFAAGVQMSFHNPDPAKPRWSWRIVAAQIALVLAAGALAFCGALLIGFGDMFGPLTRDVGWSMEGAAFLAILTACFF